MKRGGLATRPERCADGFALPHSSDFKYLLAQGAMGSPFRKECTRSE